MAAAGQRLKQDGIVDFDPPSLAAHGLLPVEQVKADRDARTADAEDDRELLVRDLDGAAA